MYRWTVYKYVYVKKCSYNQDLLYKPICNLTQYVCTHMIACMMLLDKIDFIPLIVFQQINYQIGKSNFFFKFTLNYIKN